MARGKKKRLKKQKLWGGGPRPNCAKARYRIKQLEIDNSCFYCGTPLNRWTSTLDHLVPKSKGGTNNRKNLVVCCVPCNTKKADLSVEEFMELFDFVRQFLLKNRLGYF